MSHLVDLSIAYGRARRAAAEIAKAERGRPGPSPEAVAATEAADLAWATYLAAARRAGATEPPAPGRVLAALTSYSMGGKRVGIEVTEADEWRPAGDDRPSGWEVLGRRVYKSLRRGAVSRYYVPDNSSFRPPQPARGGW